MFDPVHVFGIFGLLILALAIGFLIFADIAPYTPDHTNYDPTKTPDSHVGDFKESDLRDFELRKVLCQVELIQLQITMLKESIDDQIKASELEKKKK